ATDTRARSGSRSTTPTTSTVCWTRWASAWTEPAPGFPHLSSRYLATACMNIPTISRRFSTVLHIAMWMTIAACGRRDRSASDGSTVAGTDGAGSFRVALLTPGPITDQSWNAGAYNGLKEIRDSLGARISHIPTKTPAEFEENFR